MNWVEILLVILGCLLGGALVVTKLGPVLLRQRRLAHGRHNARLAGMGAVDLCAACDRPIDFHVDLYDDLHRRWWHAGCWRRLLEERDPS
jgi:hypothetical protein